MPTALQSGQTILFIGDSITDCGRRDNAHRPLGCGYVRFFADLLTIREPEKQVAILNRGIGGNTVEDLRNRWSDDCLSHRPDWLSIKIGINDCNRNLNAPDPDFLAPEGMYRDLYRELLGRVRDELPETKLLLVDPFYVSRDTAPDSYRAKVLKRVERYIAVVEELGEEFGARRVRTHQRFKRQLAFRHPDVFGPEPVHPYPIGHLLIAEAVYEALDRSPQAPI